MEGLVGWIVALVAAVVGYLVGSSRSKEVVAAAKHDLKIKITKDGSGNYAGDTDIKKKSVWRWDIVEWKIQDSGSNALPAGSQVFLRFTSGSAVVPAEPNDLGTRTIWAMVSPLQPNNSYAYKVYYRHNGVDHLLEDPVLIIEGDRRIARI